MKINFLTLFVFVGIFFLGGSDVLAVTTRQNIASKAAALKAVVPLAANISGSITSIGTNSFVVNNITINLASNTKILRRFGAKSTLKEFSVGDQVQVLGKWTDETKVAMNARLIHNLSIQKRNGTFVGTIISTNSSGFSFQPLSRPIQNVTTSSKTRFLDQKGKTTTLAKLATGHKVMVRGLWDNTTNTLSDVTLVKDYSLSQ